MNGTSSRSSSPGRRQGRRGGPLLLGVVALVAALAVSLSWLASGEPAVAVPVERTSAATPAAAVEASAPADGTDSPGDAVREAMTGLAGTGVAGDPAAAVAPAVPPEHVLVRVIDAVTRLPVAGAEVVADLPEAPVLTAAERRERDLLTDTFERLARFGQRTQTDPHGYALLPGRDDLEVAARQDDRYGEATVSVDQCGKDGFELRIAAEEQVRVRVLDAGRAPLRGVPVDAVAERDGPGSTPRRRTRRAGITDQDGVVTVRHLQSLRQPVAPKRLAVRIGSPGLADVCAEVPTDRRDVELLVPAHGALRVRVVEAGDRPVSDEPVWTVRVYGPERAGGDDWDVSVAATGAGGEVVFPCVGLGIRLYCMVNSGVSGGDVVQGPEVAGQTVEHTVSLAREGVTVVAGRLLDAAGRPIASRRFWLRPAAGSGETLGGSTDAQGRFLVRGELASEEPTIAVCAQAKLADGSIAVAAPFTLALRRTSDVGDILCAAGEILAAGRLVEERPRPPGLRLVVQQRDGDDWNDIGRMPVAVAADGTFTITRIGPAPTGALRLQAFAPGCQPVAPLEFVPGQRDLQIVLRAGAPFDARVQVAPELLRVIASEELTARLRGEGEREVYLAGSVVDGDWILRSNSCAPGVYQLIVDGALPITLLADVRVGDAVPDPRLQPLDLRERLRVLVVRTLGVDGNVIPGWGELWFRDPRSGTWLERGWFDRGRAQAVVETAPLDLCVRLYDHGHAIHTGATGAVDVVVPTSRKVKVAFDGWPQLRPDAPLDLRVESPPDWARRQGLPESMSPLLDVTADAVQGTLELQVTAAIEVKITLIRRDGDQERDLATVTCGLQGDVRLPLPEAWQRQLEPWRLPPK